MAENQNRLEELMEKFSRNEVDETEFDELCELISASTNEDAIKAKLLSELQETKFTRLPKSKLDRMLGKILPTETAPVYKMQPFDRLRVTRQWTRIAAAAVIILMLGAGVYWLTVKSHNNNLASTEKPAIKNDVAPGKEGAILTLDGGKQVVLDSAQNGSIAQQGSSIVVKENGQLTIQKGNGNNTAEVVYNTMTTPNGRQYKLVLADGSAVWLNAASSIHFPTSFPGKERRVDITGEAYFEVAHNAKQPFIVSVNGMDVKVLGTHFNINAYADEAVIKTTLLEGSVSVTKSSVSKMIKPGEQAILRQAQDDNEINVVSADVDEVMAWKNGLFSLNKTDIQTFMRMVSRWYDVDVVYEGAIPKGTISGEAQRSLSFAQMQKVLQLTDVHFKIEGRKLIVTQ